MLASRAGWRAPGAALPATMGAPLLHQAPPAGGRPAGCRIRHPLLHLEAVRCGKDGEGDKQAHINCSSANRKLGRHMSLHSPHTRPCQMHLPLVQALENTQAPSRPTRLWEAGAEAGGRATRHCHVGCDGPWHELAQAPGSLPEEAHVCTGGRGSICRVTSCGC